MSISFGDFKKNEISELIQNKDPLGLNYDIESYKTAKSEAPLKIPDTDKDIDSETKMDYDEILHNLKSATNVNNSTTKKTLKIIHLPCR